MEAMIIAFSVLFVLILIGPNNRRRVQDASRLARLERKMDIILAQMGVELPPLTASRRVMDLLEMRQKIQAIKAYREETGASLADAKDFVDELEANLKAGLGSAGRPAIGLPGEADDAANKTQIKRGL